MSAKSRKFIVLNYKYIQLLLMGKVITLFPESKASKTEKGVRFAYRLRLGNPNQKMDFRFVIALDLHYIWII